MEFNKELENLMDKLKNATLSENEKAEIHLHIIRFMDSNLAADAQERSYSKNLHDFLISSLDIIASMGKKPALRYSFASLLVFIVLGYGVVSSAQISLPGDLLYPVKTQINEKVLGLVTFSSKAKAEYNIKLAQSRLEEMEKLAIENRLNDQISKDIKELFNSHMANTRSQMSKIIDDNDTTIAAQITSDIEASLSAHANALNKINSKTYAKEGQKNNVKDLISDVEDNIEHAESERYKQQNRLFAQGENAISIESEKGFLEAKQNIKEALDYVESKKSQISDNAYNALKANLQLSKNTLVQGKTELDAKSHGPAFALLKLAERMAKEAKISAEIEANLKSRLNSLADEKNGKSNQK